MTPGDALPIAVGDRLLAWLVGLVPHGGDHALAPRTAYRLCAAGVDAGKGRGLYVAVRWVPVVGWFWWRDRRYPEGSPREVPCLLDPEQEWPAG